jgi:catalase
MSLRQLANITAMAVALTSVIAPVARADDAPVGQQIVEQMYKVFGEHPGMRANHAKGLVVEGTFTPSKAGPTLSKAILFSGGTVPVTVRFSDSTGVPTIPDGAPGASPHGMAIKFHLAGSAEMDVVVNSLKFFPVATGEEFRDLLIAVGKTTKDTPKPTPVDQFMAAHPAAPKAFASTTTPVSWGRETYNGVDAFIFVDAAGKRQPFRFAFVPVEGPKHLSAAEAAKQKPDFLTEEMTARLARKPVQFRMLAQLAGPGDSTKDPTKPWPSSRKMIDLGMLTLTKVTPDNATVARSILFMPNNLVDGVEVSDDPLIQARDEAYPVSYSKRTQ